MSVDIFTYQTKILTKLINDPKLIFKIDETVISRKHFEHALCACVYDCIKTISCEDISLSENYPINKSILKNKFIIKYNGFYKSEKDKIDNYFEILYDEDVCSYKDFMSFIRMIISYNLRKGIREKYKNIEKTIETIESPLEIISFAEKQIFEYTSKALCHSDMGNLGKNFDNWLAERQRELKESGKVNVGIETCFKYYNEYLGGAMRPSTVHVIASRPKRGKSFLGMTFADFTAHKLKVPVLYLDSEMDDNYQTIRRISMNSKVSLQDIEFCKFMKDVDKVNKVKEAKKYIEKYPITYISIKGWSIDEQISIIRRFFSRVVGKNKSGKYNPALVILDYLKLMHPRDKGADKEYEALGYRMTAMHDLISEYNSTIVMFIQQNRQGIDSDREDTISGSDRVLWLCDSFSILALKSPEEIALSKAEAQKLSTSTQSTSRISNCKLIVKECRHGPRHHGRSYIGLYADIHDVSKNPSEVCGIFEEVGLETSSI